MAWWWAGMEVKREAFQSKYVPITSDEPKSFAIPRSTAAITDSKTTMGRKLGQKLCIILLTPTAVQLPHAPMRIKEILWPQNDYGSLLQKVLKLPQFHFSGGPHYYKEVITLALMHGLHGSRGEEGDRQVKNRKMYCTVEWGRERGKKMILQCPEMELI